MSAARLAEVEAKIGEHCDSVTWTTTGIFTVSIFLSILRPDPTLTICLFGFYGEHFPSKITVNAFSACSVPRSDAGACDSR